MSLLVNLIKIMSSKIGEFSIKDIIIEEKKDCERGLWHEVVIDSEYPHLIGDVSKHEISNSEQMALIYIAGYAVHKISKSTNCSSCLSILRYDNLLELEQESEGETASYLKFIDRGGLKKPKPEIVLVLVTILQLFKCLTSPDYEESLFRCKSQKQMLCSLALSLVTTQTTLSSSICNVCDTKHTTFLKRAIQTFGNILLNNYSKMLKNKIIEDKFEKNEKRKVKKLGK